MTPEEISAVRGLLGWSKSGGVCPDCERFREAPSCIRFLHHKDCDYLEQINEVNALMGYDLWEGHDYDDPKAEMKRLAEERYKDCVARGLVK